MRYRGLLWSVMLFIVIDLGVLALNFVVTYQIDQDALEVNLAGRQRMLTQRMGKALFILEPGPVTSVEQVTALGELRSSSELFHQTLMAFTDGGKAINAVGNEVLLDRVSAGQARQAIDDALPRWRPYHHAIEQFVQEVSASGEAGPALQTARNQALLHGNALLDSMNQLTVALEDSARVLAARMRMIQSAGILLVLGNVLFIVFYFLRQMRASDREVEQARSETSEILNSVNEGLFLIDRSLVIGQQHSAHLETLLECGGIAGARFDMLLRPHIDVTALEQGLEFIELMFNPRVRDRLIVDLNPLHVVKAQFPRAGATDRLRHLRFEFARAWEGNRIKHVLVTVQDITAEVQLAHALEKTRQQSDSQIELVTNLLRVPPELLQEFLQDAARAHDSLHELLRQLPTQGDIERSQIESLYREVHTYKGNAALLGLTYFEEAAHLMEDELSIVKGLGRPAQRRDLTRFALMLEDLVTYAARLERTAGHLGEVAEVFKPEVDVAFAEVDEASSALEELAERFDFTPLVRRIAREQGKQVSLRVSGLEYLPDDDTFIAHLRDICIQLLRNAVVHGVEPAEHRLMRRKPTVGRIQLVFSRVGEGLRLVVEDDGRGLDLRALRKRGQELGRWSEEEAAAVSNDDLVALLFEDGVTTATQVDQHAGRGVGMSAVRERVRQYHGRINVSSRRGHMTAFELSFPKLGSDRQSAESAA